MRTMKKMILLLLIFSLSACSTPSVQAPPEIASPITLVDGLDRTVELPASAQRIVSLAPSNTEILFAIGAGGQVIGRDEFSNYPEEALALPSIGGSMGNYNLEAITALQPDLVLATEINTPEQVQSLENLGLNIYYLANPTDLEGLLTNLEIVGSLTGRQAEAETLVESLRARVEAVQTALAATTTQPVVFYEIDGSDAARPWTVGPGTFISLLLSQAGAVNAGDMLDSAYAQISLEELLIQQPEYILLGDSNYGVTPESVMQREGWSSLTAVQEDRVLVFNDDLVSRPGPRLVDGLETLARLIHPEAFNN